MQLKMTPAPHGADAVPQRSRLRRIALRVLFGVVLTALAIWLVLFITRGRFLKSPFEAMATSVSDREVTVGGDFQLYFAPFDIKFVAEDLAVANPAWATRPHLLTASRIDTRIAPLSLLFGTTRLRWLDLTGATADLEWNADHTANSWTFAERPEPLELPLIGKAAIDRTKLRYRDPQMALTADIDFAAVAATEARIDDAVRFTGTAKLRATAFALKGALLSPNETLARGENRLEMTATTATDRIDIAGTLPSAAEIEGVPLKVSARGNNAANLLGILAVVIPDTRRYRLDAEMVKRGTRYDFGKLKGTFGASDIGGGFTLETGGARRHVRADLVTRTLDIIDVAPFMGYNPDLVAARGFAAAAAQAGAAPDRLLPDTSLRAEGLRLFDADVHYRVARVRSKSVPVTAVDAVVKLDDGLLSLSPFTFVMQRGKVASDILIDWRRRPARTRYDFRLGDTPLGQLLKGYGIEESGTSGTMRGRIALEGDGDTLHESLATSRGRIAFVIPKAQFWTRNVQLAELDFGTFIQKLVQGKLKEPVQVNCGLVAFTVRSGAATADPILIDTTKNVILGGGGFSFVDESLDLSLRADAKKFSLASAQSPLGFRGTFANPSLRVISPQLIGRAGAAVGLGAVLPPAALLAFIDFGDAKATACGPVLAGATAMAQRTTTGKPRDDVGAGQAVGKPKKKFLGIF